MPSASRVIFVSIPFLLTLGTLVGVLLTFTGNVSSNTIAQYFHFLEVNTSGIPDLDAFYTVGLWNYCSSNTPFKTTGYCSAARAGYFFDPRSVLNLPVTLTSTIDPKYENALPKLQTLSRYTFGLYIAAIALSTLTLLVSILAFQRRLGSLLAALISAATCLVTLAASSAATVLFAVEMGVVKALAEKQYSAGGLADDQSAIRAELGRHALAATWIAGACSIVAFVFWLLTACCCKGRVGGEGQKVRVQKEAVYEPRGARSY